MCCYNIAEFLVYVRQTTRDYFLRILAYTVGPAAVCILKLISSRRLSSEVL